MTSSPQSSPAPPLPPEPFAGAHEARTGALDLVQFAYQYTAGQRGVMLLSAGFMAGATVLSMAIPALAEEIVSYGTATVTMSMGDTMPAVKRSPAMSPTFEVRSGVASQAAMDGTSEGADHFSLFGLGLLSERIFKPVLPIFFHILQRSGSGGGSDALGVPGELAWPTLYAQGILCRCLLMTLVIISYHFTSLIAHLAAYFAGMGAQNSLTQHSVERILHTLYPERVAVVNAVKLAQLITASGKAVSDSLGDLLTNILSQMMYVAGFFVVMMFLSYQLTLTILVGIVVVQCLFFFQGRSLHRQGSHVTAEETSVQAYIANILQRSQTVFVFHCSDFVLGRLAERLSQVRVLTNGLNCSIHGFAAISSGFTRLILVLALGLSNYYQQRGQLDMRHTILYFACFQSLVNTLVSLSSAVSQLRATLGRLKTLEAMLRWYSEPLQLVTGGRSPSATAPLVSVEESPTAPVALENVSFAYPPIPAFFSEVGRADGDDGNAVCAIEAQLSATMGSRHCNGVTRVSFTAAVGGITALYGPSGSGKSTCLRLLCGLVRPHAGTVRTQRRAVLLEQQHAIFIGSVAENILLTDLSNLGQGEDGAGLQKGGTTSHGTTPTDVQRRVTEAAVKSGCASFLSNPFTTTIESVDHPQFSGGQLQRIAIARVFAQTDGYSLVLLDEPTSGLDRTAVEVLLQTLQELRDKHNKTVLISTHDHRVSEIADKVIDLSLLQ